MVQRKNLILITASFPFGTGEAFIRSEFPFLCDHFRSIFIFTQGKGAEINIHIPSHVTVFPLPELPGLCHKISSLALITQTVFRAEVKIAREKYGLKTNFRLKKIAALSMKMGRVYANIIGKEIFDKQGLHPNDTLIYSYWLSDAAIAAALLRDKFKGVKSIARAHGWDVYFERHNPKYLPFRNLLFQNLDAIYTVSENGRKYLIDKALHTDDCPVKLSRLGTLNHFSLPVFDMQNPQLKIASCSSVIPLKRLDMLAAGITKIESPSVHWEHFGGGENLPDLQQQSKTLIKGRDQKHIFHGNIPNDEVLAHLHRGNFDLFINTSSYEGIPVSIMEALSFGIPVVATAVGGTPEIVKHGINGILLRADCTAEDIASAILEYYHYPSEKKLEMRRMARQSWEKEYNAAVNYPAFIAEVAGDNL
jgi:colanic acid/amylovoran biosynthesis glycosyltransferase